MRGDAYSVSLSVVVPSTATRSSTGVTVAAAAPRTSALPDAVTVDADPSDPDSIGEVNTLVAASGLRFSGHGDRP
jgi:hypothetical protein